MKRRWTCSFGGFCGVSCPARNCPRFALRMVRLLLSFCLSATMESEATQWIRLLDSKTKTTEAGFRSTRRDRPQPFKREALKTSRSWIIAQITTEDVIAIGTRIMEKTS